MPRCDGAASCGGPPRETAIAARKSAVSARARRASASCWRAARRQCRWRNQVAMPPAATPRMATEMITTNSGIDTAIAGSVELKGSNDTVTKWRLATAKTMKMSPKGMTTSAVKNFRMTIARSDRERRATGPQHGYKIVKSKKRLRAGLRRAVLAVQPLAHFLAGLEERNALLVDRNMGAGARIAACARGAMLDRESAEPSQFDTVAARERCDNLIEDRVHNVLHIPLVKVRVVLGDALNKFGFDHRSWDPGACGYPFP